MLRLTTNQPWEEEGRSISVRTVRARWVPAWLYDLLFYEVTSTTAEKSHSPASERKNNRPSTIRSFSKIIKIFIWEQWKWKFKQNNKTTHWLADMRAVCVFMSVMKCILISAFPEGHLPTFSLPSFTLRLWESHKEMAGSYLTSISQRKHKLYFAYKNGKCAL